MFNYLNIEFPTLNYPLMRAWEFSQTHAKYEHETMSINFADWAVPYDSIASGTPVTVTLKGLSSSRTINGYVHHAIPKLSPEKNHVELFVIGASYLLKQQSQKVWVDYTADQVVAEIAKKHGFSYIADPHPRVYEQISQGGMSDWELLVKLAKQSGYVFYADNATLVFQHVSQSFTEMREQASYHSMGTLEGKSTGIYKFTPLIGEAIPYKDGKKASPTVGGVDKLLSTNHTKTNQKKIKATRKKYVDHIFDTYQTNVVAPSFDIAKYESDAAEQLGKYSYRGKVEVPGHATYVPHDIVFLDNIGDSYSGYWTILSVSHYINQEVYTTTLEVGADSLGITAKWRGNKDISSPNAVVKRIITPGVRQKIKISKTKLKANKKPLKQNSSSHFSLVKNKQKTTSTTAASYTWKSSGGNLRSTGTNDKKMPTNVMVKMVQKYGK